MSTSLKRTPLYAEAIVRGDVPLVVGATPYLQIRHAVEVIVLLGGLAVLLIAALGSSRRRAAGAPDVVLGETEEARLPGDGVAGRAGG